MGGVSPRCRIEQIRAGGTLVDPCPSQSEQYLIGSRDKSPPTKRCILGFKGKPPPSPFGLPMRSYVKECVVHASQCADLILAHMITHTMVHPSLSQRLIRQGWEASLPMWDWANSCGWDVGQSLPIPKWTIPDWELKWKITHTTVHPSLGQRFIRQGWEASLLDVGLNKFVQVGCRSILAHPKANNTWLGARDESPLTVIYNILCIIKKYIKFGNYFFHFKQTFSNSFFSTLQSKTPKNIS